MRQLAALVLALVMLIARTEFVAAQAKFAFVVGINKYDHLPGSNQLTKAVGDAKALTSALTDLGFQVTTEVDTSRSDFFKRWHDFLSQIAAGDTVAIAFSGHGIEVSGGNYLLPRDIPKIRAGRELELTSFAIPVQILLGNLRDKQPGLTLLVLDACRNNPLIEGGRSVGTDKGLGKVDPPDGTFIMYSAGTHEIALDRLSDIDDAPTSVYMRTLLPMLKTPGLSLLNLADDVSVKVRELAESTGQLQRPAFYSGVSGASKICLAGCAKESRATAIAAVQPPPKQIAPEVRPAVRLAVPQPRTGPQPRIGVASPLPRVDGDGDCTIVGESFSQPIAVTVGMKFCDPTKSQWARIDRVEAGVGLEFETNGRQRTIVCGRQSRSCQFGWEGSPRFKVVFSGGSNGGAESVEIHPF